MDMELASLIATIVAGVCLIGLVYIALFMDRWRDECKREWKRDIERMDAHYKRWEDRI